MTKNEFLDKLKSELNKRNVNDSADIIEEYEQYFNYKMTAGIAFAGVSVCLPFNTNTV